MLIFRLMVLVCCTLFISGCAYFQKQDQARYVLNADKRLYDLDGWSFSGRIAVKDERDSFTANFLWTHHNGIEEVELSGPFGQGRILLEITEHHVSIDDGDKKQFFAGHVDAIIHQKLGVYVPVSALRFWVLGLVDPRWNYDPVENGFEQMDWRVVYSQMQTIHPYLMPRKIKMQNEDKLVKIVIQSWDIAS